MSYETDSGMRARALARLRKEDDPVLAERAALLITYLGSEEDYREVDAARASRRAGVEAAPPSGFDAAEPTAEDIVGQPAVPEVPGDIEFDAMAKDLVGNEQSGEEVLYA
ncbi:MAG: hypothetical protein ACREJM_04735 [Candidatus Saccharimonadales bacterium]